MNKLVKNKFFTLPNRSVLARTKNASSLVSERMSTRAAAAASAGGSGGGGARCGGKPRFFSVSSNPGPGGKIFFFFRLF